MGAALGATAAAGRARRAGRAAPLRLRLLRDLAGAASERRTATWARGERALGALIAARAERLAGLGARLGPARARALGDAAREVARARATLADAGARLEVAARAGIAARGAARGFAIVRAGGRVITSCAAAEGEARFEVEFRDGRLTLGR
ncbi:MAG: hypothetical protein ACO3OO_11405 [Gemmobacter sp.]